jgi:nicotinate-nucleotide adenylyltransferase
MKVGLFFGSFNPIHTGHLIVAQAVLEQPGINQIWFIVSPRNPLKKNANLLHEFDRLDLVNAAIWDNPKMKAKDIEFRLPKPNYTINTIIALKEKHPKHEFFLIIGQDNLGQFPRWKNHKEILKEVHLYVYPRPNAQNSELDKHSKVKFIEAPLLDISATLIRKSVKKGRSIKYLVPETIEEMIRRKKFYL